jgi:type II secretory pathway pseudopilin PulG
MVELLVVIGLILTISAVAIPNVVTGVRSYRLNRTASEVSNILQRTRYEAIRRNVLLACRAEKSGNTVVMWVDVNENTRLDATEPQIVLPGDIQFIGSGSAPDAGSMGFSNTTPLEVPFNVTYDSRGTVYYGTEKPSVYLLFVSYPNNTQYGFRAVSLTPLGKTHVWRMNKGDDYWHSQ